MTQQTFARTNLLQTSDGETDVINGFWPRVGLFDLLTNLSGDWSGL